MKKIKEIIENNGINHKKENHHRLVKSDNAKNNADIKIELKKVLKKNGGFMPP